MSYLKGALQQYHFALLLLGETYARAPSTAAEARIWRVLDYAFELQPGLSPTEKARFILTEMVSRTTAYQQLRRMKAPSTMKNPEVTNTRGVWNFNPASREPSRSPPALQQQPHIPGPTSPYSAGSTRPQPASAGATGASTSSRSVPIFPIAFPQAPSGESTGFGRLGKLPAFPDNVPPTADTPSISAQTLLPSFIGFPPTPSGTGTSGFDPSTSDFATMMQEPNISPSPFAPLLPQTSFNGMSASQQVMQQAIHRSGSDASSTPNMGAYASTSGSASGSVGSGKSPRDMGGEMMLDIDWVSFFFFCSHDYITPTFFSPSEDRGYFGFRKSHT
jgi:hypothetical protein